MRLRTVDPPLPSALLAALEGIGIRTDADLIFYGPPMELYKKLPLGTVTLAELTAAVEAVVRYVAAPGVCGEKLLEKVERRLASYPAEEFSSGIPQLDKLIGGFGGSRVIEISGDRGSGKTVSLSSGLVIHSLIVN
jgi:RAD51-like protein 3